MIKFISLEESQKYQRMDRNDPNYDLDDARFYTLTPTKDGWEVIDYYMFKPHMILKEGNNEGNSHIYIITNPSMPGMVKIGYTSKKDPLDRIKQLNKNTGIPTNFKVEYLYRYYGGEDFERHIHKQLSEYRVNNQREFFYMDVAEAIEQVRFIAEKNNNIK